MEIAKFHCTQCNAVRQFTSTRFGVIEAYVCPQCGHMEDKALIDLRGRGKNRKRVLAWWRSFGREWLSLLGSICLATAVVVLVSVGLIFLVDLGLN